jgi:hypothetical protein
MKNYGDDVGLKINFSQKTGPSNWTKTKLKGQKGLNKMLKRNSTRFQLRATYKHSHLKFTVSADRSKYIYKPSRQWKLLKYNTEKNVLRNSELIDFCLNIYIWRFDWQDQLLN